MSNEIQKFWEDSKKAIIVLVAVILLVLSSLAQAMISTDKYIAQAPPNINLVPAFQLQIKNNDGTAAVLKCASSPDIPDYYVCWFSND
ncbi:MAG: hypothetical protein KAQ67_07560 [Gammaproteobacteria bacterium]|nr:hypothetical protein [Gammaproteobacteria bacterium]